MFEFVDHQPVAIDAQALLGDGRASHIAAHALECAARVAFAADGHSSANEPLKRQLRGNVVTLTSNAGKKNATYSGIRAVTVAENSLNGALPP